jgi:hypothetical protein
MWSSGLGIANEPECRLRSVLFCMKYTIHYYIYIFKKVGCSRKKEKVTVSNKAYIMCGILILPNGFREEII